MHPEPQPPQLCGSLLSLTHSPLQHERPPAQTPFAQGPPEPSELPVSMDASLPPLSFVEPSFIEEPSVPPSVAPPSMFVVVPLHARTKTETKVQAKVVFMDIP